MTGHTERVARIARREWWLFGSQYVEGEDSKAQILMADDAHGAEGRGDLPGFRQRVWSYFRDGVFPDDGEMWRDYRQWAWSGAFISWVYRMAGAGADFPYSPAHYAYVMAGVHNRLAGKPDEALLTFDTSERAPAVGDMLWKGRMETAGWGFAELEARAGDDGHFRSHCDIVTGIDRDAGRLYLIGGNVRNRVLRLAVALDADGKVKSELYTAVVKPAAG
jgi:hypothetical protein